MQRGNRTETVAQATTGPPGFGSKTQDSLWISYGP